MNKIKCTMILLLGTLLACNKEEDNPNSINTYNESGTAIVVNEGNFGSNNGSATFVNSNGVSTNYIYESANAGMNIGDVIQSYTVVGNKGIFCVNNSNKIVIVDARTFKHLATISDNSTAQLTNYTRYALKINDTKAYVSNGNSIGHIVVLDLNTNTIASSIEVGKGPEQLALVGNNVYVCNSGGFGVDSTVSLINSTTDAVTAIVTVGDIPTKLVKDAQNNIWVLCAGQTDYSAWPNITKLSASKLVRINTTTNSVDKQFTLINTGSLSYTLNLAVGDNGRKLYYSIGDKIFEHNIVNPSLPTTPIISGRDYYGLAASPFTNQIWALHAPNFTSSGSVFRYTSTGTLIDSIQVGIGPNNVVFNN